MTTETPVIPAEALPPEGGEDYAAQMIARAEGAKPPQKAPEQKPEEQKPNEQQNHDWEKRFKDLQAEFTKLKQGQAKPAEAPKPNAAQINLALAEKAANDAAAKAASKDATDADKAAAWQAEQALKAAKAEAEKAPEEKAEKVEEDDANLPEEAKQAKALADKAGLNWTEINNHFAQHGELGEAHYEALAKIGIPKEMVDQFTSGQVALANQARSEMLSVAGGEEAYVSMVSWAKDNMSADEIESYNKIVRGNDMQATKIAIAGLKARYEGANGAEPNLITGDTSNTSVVGFKSTSELKKAMADPRYDSDPDYRREVENRLRISSIM